ncbi:WavE lipopolysaccharide synthesis family protein [Photorhabdus bodei]|uniref:WavE lipopolysaccharide synthesis n=1 Tax=Photorhabdus bodei TaxID=2029681 RepID=A0A329X7B8_9GAMM|nr:WavE lipopolysaccharide synthesis family protein [Photorhabdus bodei]RAX12737.1 WavE lipopolysaccharide synthesis [Photorhabdus bodei]
MKGKIDIVMQGTLTANNKIDKQLVSYVLKVRRLFPHSRLILSTWEVDDFLRNTIEKISRYFDIDILFNTDPGAITTYFNGIKYSSNINRMLVSTYQGILHSDNEYIVKLRTDSYFYNTNIMELMETYIINNIDNLKRDENYTIFKERMINCNLFARNAKGYLPYLFHPGDILLAGRRIDLEKLFSIELANKDIFQTHTRMYFYTMMRFVPEQYIWVKCIEKQKGYRIFPGNQSHSNELIEESERFYVNNFFVADSNTLGFKWPKHTTHYHNKGTYSIYTNEDWKRMYNKYVLKIPNKINLYHLYERFVTIMMIIYFMIRTNLLRIPFIKQIAIKRFYKRG